MINFFGLVWGAKQHIIIYLHLYSCAIGLYFLHKQQEVLAMCYKASIL